MIREAHQRGDFGLLKHSWLGVVAAPKHFIAIGFKDSTNNGATSWFFGIFHWPKSSCLLWPVARRVVGNYTFFEVDVTIKEPVVRPLFDLKSAAVAVSSYTWRSWLWQVHHLGDNARSLLPAIRAFADGEQCCFVTVAARNAFWDLPKSVVAAFAVYYELDVSPGATLLEAMT